MWTLVAPVMIHFGFCLLFFLFFSLVRSGTTLTVSGDEIVPVKKRSPSSFQLFSTSPKPTMIFVKDIMIEFEANWTELQNAYLDEFLDELLTIWETQIKYSSSRVKNFYALDPKEREMQAEDPVLYYMVQVAAVFSTLSPFLLIPFNCMAIENGTEIGFHLMDALEQKCLKALTHALCSFIISDSPAAIKIIQFYPRAIDLSVDPTEKGQQLTPLAIALLYGKVQMVRTLIKFGADVNAPIVFNPEYGSIPVLFAAFHNSEERQCDIDYMVGEILSCNTFKPELCIDNQGNNPLVYIAKFGLPSQSLSSVEDAFDIANPGDKTLFDAYGWSIVHGEVAHSRILQFSPFFRANKTDPEGATYLMMAAQYNRVDVIAELLRINQDLHCQELEVGYFDHLNRTSFIFAIANRSYDALALLVEHAEEWEINNRYGANPLSFAIFYADLTAVTIILKHPQISLECPIGPSKFPIITVFEYAKCFANPDILQLLSTKINN